MDFSFLRFINVISLVILTKRSEKMNNPNSPLTYIHHKVNSITVSKEANQVLFFKYSGKISCQIILTDTNNNRKKRGDKKRYKNF